MANFTAISLELNDGNTATPNYISITGAGRDMRWSDRSDLTNTASASANWAIIRPGSGTAIIAYLYAFTADAVGQGVYSAATSVPAAFARADYLQARWNWDNTGTFAAAPVLTAYGDTNHNTPAARATSVPTSSLLAGNQTDTGATARSYLKANAFGQVGAPSAGPGADPTVTDGSTTSISPTAGANWLTNFQGLMADVDYITSIFTPAATTAGVWHIELAAFIGANLPPASNTPVISLRYAWL